MAKPVDRFILDTRAANRILTILKNEPFSARVRILSFVNSSVDDLREDEERLALASARQPVLPFVVDGRVDSGDGSGAL